jgi:hypothetical protein
MAFFYLRLTNGLKRYYTRIYIAIGLIITTFIVVIIAIYASCRPFYAYWQIQPDPGNACQAAVSKPILWSSFITNVSTDVFLILIPIPMLWKSSLRFLKKIAATLVLSAGVFIIVCATLKSIFVIVVSCNTCTASIPQPSVELAQQNTNILKDPVHGGQLAAEWGTRETFIAIVTTNLPMTFPLLKTWFAPLLPSSLRSSSNNKAYKSPGSGFMSIGGGGASSRNRQGPQSTVTANMTFDNDSEERIIQGNGDVKMQDMHTSDGAPPTNAIVVKKQVKITTEERTSGQSIDLFQQV